MLTENLPAEIAGFKRVSSIIGGNGTGIVVYMAVAGDVYPTGAMAEAGHLVHELYEQLNFELRAATHEYQEQGREQRRELIRHFPQPILVEEIPNRYWPKGRGHPWLQVTTRHGRFIVGWRKRVIHVEWTDTVIKKRAEELFPDAETTMGDFYMHVNDYEDLGVRVRRLSAEPVPLYVPLAENPK